MKSEDNFKLGTCTVPDGEKGPWKISTFTLTDDDVRRDNFRNALNGCSFMNCRAGTYKRLTRGGTVVMSNTPMEINTNYVAYRKATGRVLLNGLGMGMLLEAILSKPDVEYVRVIEVSQDLIDLVGPHFANDKRVEIICADAMEYTPEKGEHFDYAWHDIWDEITEDNLPSMATLGRRYGKRRCSDQDHWCRDIIRSWAR